MNTRIRVLCGGALMLVALAACGGSTTPTGATPVPTAAMDSQTAAPMDSQTAYPAPEEVVPMETTAYPGQEQVVPMETTAYPGVTATP